MTRRIVAIVIVGSALVGLGVTPAAALPKKPVCKIVTEGDIEELFGTAPTDTVEDGQKGKYSTCTWHLTAADGSQSIAFIGIDKPNSLNKKDFKENSASPTAEKVAGIKKGFIDGNTITFIKGANFVNVQHLGAGGAPEATDTVALTALAKLIYGEL